MESIEKADIEDFIGLQTIHELCLTLLLANLSNMIPWKLVECCKKNYEITRLWADGVQELLTKSRMLYRKDRTTK